MTSASPKPTKKSLPRRAGNAGGPAAAGGLHFQAAVAAIAVTACATGRSVEWWEGISVIPQSVWSETAGPGDDIRLTLLDGRIAEIQAKQRLRRGAELWEALLKLARGLSNGTISLGLLAVSSGTSQAISQDLARDLGRLAAGRTDDLTEIGQDFLDRLRAEGLDIARSCQGLTIQVIHAQESDTADIRQATTRLELLVNEPSDAARAWSEILADAIRLIERRGARDALAVARLLSERGVGLKPAPGREPALAAIGH